MEVMTFIWPEPATGFWNFQITTNSDIPHPSNEAEIYLLLGNDSPLEIATHLNTYDLQLGQEVGLVARSVMIITIIITIFLPFSLGCLTTLTIRRTPWLN
mgnify:CR=1 FL=1